jgi:CRISPR-associated protein Cas1
MIDVVIDKQGLGLKMESANCLRIEADGRLLQRIPAKHISSLVINAKATLDSGVLQAMIAHGIPFVVLPGRRAKTAVMLQGATQGSIATRLIQFHCYGSTAVKREIAAMIVQKKLASMHALYHALADATASPVFDTAASTAANNFPNNVRKDVGYWSVRLQQAQHEEEIRGVEGFLSRYWFALMQQKLPLSWQFTQRNRRPPKDPVNALLSLSYTLLLSRIQSAIAHRGLDMELGFLHELLPGRPSLALDLMEPVRPWVDIFVTELLIREQFSLDDFYPHDGGVWLRKEARSKYYACWYGWKKNVVYGLPAGTALPTFDESTTSCKEIDLDTLCYRVVDSFANYLIRNYPAQADSDPITAWAVQGRENRCPDTEDDDMS